VIIADPDFGLEPRPSGELTHEKALSRTVAAPDLVPSRNSPDYAALGKVKSLDGLEREAFAIQEKLPSYCAGQAPIPHLKEDALESVCKALVRPRVLVLSTHGFFLPNDRLNPLLCCGLYLAGCNRRERWISAGGEDGILTGLEVLGIDLRGTELVVLSACETGLGTIQSGDGVASLRQAFQRAGAESVVASLWQVPDIETAQLMEAFFDELSRSGNKAEALCRAQCALIATLRRGPGSWEEPYLWAGFTVTSPVLGRGSLPVVEASAAPLR
jgi:CHAT domain-containing protein